MENIRKIESSSWIIALNVFELILKANLTDLIYRSYINLINLTNIREFKSDLISGGVLPGAARPVKRKARLRKGASKANWQLALQRNDSRRAIVSRVVPARPACR